MKTITTLKRTLMTAAIALSSGCMYGQVGVNTTTPKATLDVVAKTTDGSRPEGFIAPRLSGDQIKAADAQYTSAQTGMIVYATSAVTTPSVKTSAITSAGYYSFNGSTWQAIGNGANIYNTDGTLSGSRTMSQGSNSLSLSGSKGNVVTNSSDALLDLQSTSSTLLLPRLATTTSVAAPVNGMLLYDKQNECFKGYANGAWTDCFGKPADPSIASNCSQNGFTGTLKSGISLSGATFSVTLTNNSFSTANISFAATDLALGGAGASGISVSAVSPASVTLNAGASQMVTYSLSGTPSSCGTLTGSWTKLSLNCTKSTTVAANPVFNCGSGTWATVSPEYRLTGLMNGTAYSGTYSIPYTGGGCTYAGETLTSNGLSLTLVGGSYSTTGSLTYTLSGTYTGTNNGSVSFTTSSGCTIYLGPCTTCKEIKDKGLGTTDGVYYVDIDQAGSTYSPMKAYCDMTTDGGGWTLVLNYLHQGGTNPSFTVKTTSFPLIGSTSLGVDESSSTTNWGHLSNSMLNAMSFTSIRFYGKTSAHSRIMHFKTSLSNGISYIKTGTGNFSGLGSSFTALSGHNAYLPAAMDGYFSNQGDRALIYAPFWKNITYHWNIAGDGSGSTNRWEVDDFPLGSGNSTYNQVWVR